MAPTEPDELEQSQDGGAWEAVEQQVAYQETLGFVVAASGQSKTTQFRVRWAHERGLDLHGHARQAVPPMPTVQPFCGCL